MIDKIGNFDENLYQRFLDIKNSWENQNRAIFTVIQSYTEYLIKSRIKYLNKGTYLEQRDTLGSLLGKIFVLQIFKYHYGLLQKDIEILKDINNKANEYKHGELINNVESQTISYIKDIYRITSTILSKDYNCFLPSELDIDFFERPNIKSFFSEVEEVELHNSKEQIAFIDKNISQKSNEYSKKIESVLEQNKLSNVEETLPIKDEIRTEFIQLIKDMEEPNIDEKRLFDLKSRKTELEELVKLNKFEEYYSPSILNERVKAIENRMKVELNSLNKNKQQLEKLYTNIKSDKKNRSHEYYLSHFQQFNVNSNYSENSAFSVYGIMGNIGKSESKYSHFYATIFNQLIRGKSITPSIYIRNNVGSEDFSVIYKIQIAVLLLLKQNSLTDSKWSINFINRNPILAKQAIQDIFMKCQKLANLSKTKYTEPELFICSKPYQFSMYNISFDVNYPNRKSVLVIYNYTNTKLYSIKPWFENRISYSISKIDDENNDIKILNDFLEELFGHNQFLSGQIEILINVLNGNSTIGILTTGGGKSLIYQFAALMQPKITLIIDPMNSLIFDQMRKLRDDYNITSVSEFTGERKNNLTARENIENFYLEPTIFAFSSPERFFDTNMRDLLISMNDDICLIVLDEVHCLSEWGHDFRTSYLMLIHTINTYVPDAQYLGLTATAAINVLRDLQIELDIFNPKNIVFNGQLKRENLTFKIVESTNEALMTNYLNTFIIDAMKDSSKENLDSIIVFMKDKNSVEKFYQYYSNLHPNKIAYFHGDHKKHQDSFINDERNILFSTNAFGMGIDKPNVRKTIHFGSPSSRENFFQEAGRCGRDGKLGECILLTYAPSLQINNQVSLLFDFKKPITDIKKIVNDMPYQSFDFRINAYFLFNAYDSVDIETKHSMELYDFLIEDNNKIKYHKIQSNFKKKQRVEKDLYILHKIGIVRNWSLVYSDRHIQYTIHVSENANNIDNIVKYAQLYISKYSKNHYFIEDLSKINHINDLHKVITIIRTWYHDTFLRSRREQFANMYEFVQKYKNKSASDEIQLEMSKYFDASRLITHTNIDRNYNYENDSISVIANKAFDTSEPDLEHTRMILERLLESDENYKINLFTSLIHLRLNRFDSRNGRDRLIYTINELRNDQKDEMYKCFNEMYAECNNSQKEKLIDAFYTADREALIKATSLTCESDNLIATYHIHYINQSLSDIF